MSGEQVVNGVRVRKMVPKHVPMSLDGQTSSDLFIDVEMVIQFSKILEVNNSARAYKIFLAVL